MTSPHVPYQAYKSKRHVRSSSNPQFELPVQSSSSAIALASSSTQPSNSGADTGRPVGSSAQTRPNGKPRPHSMIVSSKSFLESGVGGTEATAIPVQAQSPAYFVAVSDDGSSNWNASRSATSSSSVQGPTRFSLVNGATSSNGEASVISKPSPPRRASTFRRVPLREAGSTPQKSSPLRPANGTAGTQPRPSSTLAEPRVRLVSNASQASTTLSGPTTQSLAPTGSHSPALSSPVQSNPPSRLQTPSPAYPPSITSFQNTPRSELTSSPPPIARPPAPSGQRGAPYRPGFQPKGVYRHRTDEFMELRNQKRGSESVEDTRRARRLEKLIDLHFNPKAPRRPSLKERRTSSIFELDFSSTGDLFKSMMESKASSPGKSDIREAEQAITPWQDDNEVSQCPLCSSKFHPLSNRRHHCRLCGKVICSLPAKQPSRPETCSILFIVDLESGNIREVSENIDYGVQKRTDPSAKEKSKASVDENFLKGTFLEIDQRYRRQQYHREGRRKPDFLKLYDMLIALEQDIESCLPRFEELMGGLPPDGKLSQEIIVLKKQLTEAFANYDLIAKRIKQLPTPGGKGTAQERIQDAIMTRAALFLQQNMLPFQASIKPKKRASKDDSTQLLHAQVSDLDSEMAHTLQPLFEQEALLESFVEEAKAHRKFEDAKTLKVSLMEIRAEIDRIAVAANIDS